MCLLTILHQCTEAVQRKHSLLVILNENKKFNLRFDSRQSRTGHPQSKILATPMRATVIFTTLPRHVTSRSRDMHNERDAVLTQCAWQNSDRSSSARTANKSVARSVQRHRGQVGASSRPRPRPRPYEYWVIRVVTSDVNMLSRHSHYHALTLTAWTQSLSWHKSHLADQHLHSHYSHTAADSQHY